MFYIIALVLAFISGILSQEGDITLDSYTLNAMTAYTFSVFLSGDYVFVSGTTLQITFPSQYTGLLSNGIKPCATNSSWPNSATLTCTVSSLVLTVSNGFPTTYTVNDFDYFDLTVTGIKNPPYSGVTSVFTGRMVNSSSGTLPITFGQGLGVTIMPGSLGCSMTTLGSSVVNTNSRLVVLITPQNPIPSGGTVSITTELFWPSDYSRTDPNYIFSQTGFTCQVVSGSISGSMTCSISILLVTPRLFVITVSSLFTSSISTPFSISLGPFTTPPTTKAQGTFGVSTTTSNGSFIDKVSGVKVSGITPSSITNLAFSMTPTTINSVAQAVFSFTNINYLWANDSISLVFSSGLTFGSTVTVSAGSYVKTGNTVVVTGAVTGITAISLTVTGVINPPSTQVITGFSVSTLRGTASMDSSSNSVTYQASVSSLTASLTALNTQTGGTTVYTFLITLSNPITTTAYIIINFPPDFTMSNGNFPCTSNRSQTTPTCSYTSRVMTVTNAVSAANLPAGSVISLVVQGMVNPLALGLFSSMVITTTYNTSTSYVDTATSGVSFVVTSRTLTAANVVLTSSNYTVFSVATLSFLISNQNPILSNSNLFIGFPVEVVPTSASCQVNLLGVSCTSVTYKGYQGLWLQGINTASVAVEGLASLPVTISNVQMPKSTIPSSSFQVYIVFSDGTVSQFLTTGLTIVATLPSKYTALSLSSSSPINYASSTFTVDLTPLFIIPNNSVITITYPTSMTGTTSCSTNSASLSSVGCTFSANIVTIVVGLPATQTVATRIIFTLNNILNYPTMAQYSIQLTLRDPTGSYLSSQDTYTLMNTQPNSVSIAYGSFSPSIMLQATTLTTSITPSIPMTGNSYILVTFPSEFVLGAISCTLASGQSCSKSGQVVRVSSSSSYTFPISISISGLTAPYLTPSSFIYVETYGSDNSLMTRDNSLFFQISCNLYCRTCSSTNPSQCVTCYNNATLVSGNTILSSGICASGCPIGQYLNSSIPLSPFCAPCPTGCAACTSSTECTQCSSPLYLMGINCIATCDDGYYPSNSNRKCMPCTIALHCSTCKTSTTCEKCELGFFSYLGYCLATCPAGITVSNTVASTCDSCPINCSQCAGYPTTVCTVCQPGYLLDQNRCALTCVTNGYVPQGLICTSCNAECLTCANTPSNCTSCDTSGPNPYFFNNKCLSSCSGGYYSNNVLFTCSPCTPPCETCTDASISSCLTCVSGTFLYQNSCQASCPAKYYINGQVCSPCLDPCLTCTAASICTSCNSTLFLLKQNCVASCLSGQIVTNPNICENCTSNCKSCVGSTNQCSACYETFYLSAGTCFSSCPDGYYISPTNVCVICTPPCKTCTSDILCVTCVDLYFLDGTTCTTTCSGNKIPINGVCTSCLPECAICVGTTSNCTQCNSGYVYTTDLNKCSINCPTGYILYAANSTCITVCPAKYYNLSGTCTSCPATCLLCNSSTYCTACVTGNVMFNNMCYGSCPPQAPYLINNTCQSCNIANCQMCSADRCVICLPSYLLINYTSCIISCPPGLVYNATALDCLEPKNNTNNNTNPTTTEESLKLTFAPAPLMIGAVASFVTLIIVRAQHPEMSLVNSFLPILSTLTIGSAVVNGLFYYFDKQVLFDLNILLKLGGIGLYLILNFVNAVCECAILPKDKKFQAGFRKGRSIVIVLILAALLTLKWAVFLASNFCNMPALNVKLSSRSFIISLRVTFFLSILSLGAFIGSSILYILSTNNYFTFLFFGAVELITLSAIQILMTFMAMSSMSDMVRDVSPVYHASEASFGLDEGISQGDGSFQQFESKGDSQMEILEESKQNYHRRSSIGKGRDDSFRKGTEKGKGKQREKEKVKVKEENVKVGRGNENARKEEQKRDYQDLKSDQQLMSRQDQSPVESIKESHKENSESLLFEEEDNQGDDAIMVNISHENKDFSRLGKSQEKVGNMMKESKSEAVKKLKDAGEGLESMEKESAIDRLKNSSQMNRNTANQSVANKGNESESVRQNTKQSMPQQDPQKPLRNPEDVEEDPLDQSEELLEEESDVVSKEDKSQLVQQGLIHEEDLKKESHLKPSDLIQDNKHQDQGLEGVQNQNQDLDNKNAVSAHQTFKQPESQLLNNNNYNDHPLQNSNSHPYDSLSSNQPDTNLRRTDSEQLNKPATPNSNHDIKSAFNVPGEVIRLKNEEIEEGVNQGLYRETLEKVIQRKKMEDEESALDEAPKMNALLNNRKEEYTQEELAEMMRKDQKMKPISKEKDKNNQPKDNKQDKNKADETKEAQKKEKEEIEYVFEDEDYKGPEEDPSDKQQQEQEQEQEQEEDAGGVDTLPQQSNQNQIDQRHGNNGSGNESRLKTQSRQKKTEGNDSKPGDVDYQERSEELEEFQQDEDSSIRDSQLLTSSPQKKGSRLKSRESSGLTIRKKSSPSLDLIAQLKEEDLANTMELKKPKEPSVIQDFIFENDEELEDPEEVLNNCRTFQPKMHKNRPDDDQLESIATVEEVDIKLPTQHRTLEARPKKMENRYLEEEQEDLRKPSEFFVPKKKKVMVPQPSVSSFASFKSKETKQVLSRAGRMSLDNSSNKPPRSSK